MISVRRSLKQQSSSDIAMHVSYVSILVNLVLSVGKFVAGIMGHSSAMISDAIHSASDVFSTIIVIFGVLLASRSSDADHPYGHEKQEYVATLFLAFVLMFTGLGIGYEGLQSILHKTYLDRESPALIAMAAAIVSIVTKEAMFWYTIRAARKSTPVPYRQMLGIIAVMLFLRLGPSSEFWGRVWVMASWIPWLLLSSV